MVREYNKLIIKRNKLEKSKCKATGEGEQLGLTWLGGRAS